MKLKGHTTIELTDVNTGKKEVHEDDNLVTTALQQLLSYKGVFDVGQVNSALSPYANANKDFALVKNTGGLLLFDGTIEENVDMIYPPAGISLVGCGSHIAYSGANLMAGSYNKSESGRVDNGYKHVWDFGTSQANGQIACACLTTCAGGKITSGSFPFSSDYILNANNTNNVDEVYETNYCLLNDYSTRYNFSKSEGGKDSLDSGCTILFLDGKNNRVLRAHNKDYGYNYTGSPSFSNSIFATGSIDIDIERLPVTSYSIFDKRQSSEDVAKENYEDVKRTTVTVNMPDGLKQKLSQFTSGGTNYYFGLCATCDESNIYFSIKQGKTSYNDNTVKKNEEMYVWKINVDTFDSTWFTVVNTTGEEIRFISAASGYASKSSGTAIFYCGVFYDYMICIGQASNKIFCIKISDSTEVVEVKYPDGTSFNYNAFYSVWYQSKNKINVSLNSGLNSGSPILVLDFETKNITYKNMYLSKYFNFNSSYSSDFRTMYRVAGTNMVCCQISASGYYNFVVPGFEQPFLVTINNLSSPVLKTASQTMKVTYTLTLADA